MSPGRSGRFGELEEFDNEEGEGNEEAEEEELENDEEVEDSDEDVGPAGLDATGYEEDQPEDESEGFDSISENGEDDREENPQDEDKGFEEDSAPRATELPMTEAEQDVDQAGCNLKAPLPCVAAPHDLSHVCRRLWLSLLFSGSLVKKMKYSQSWPRLSCVARTQLSPST